MSNLRRNLPSNFPIDGRPVRIFSITFSFVLLFSTHIVAQSTSVTIDGIFDDWEEVEIVASDPPGDALGEFDLTTLKTQFRGTRLSLFFDIRSILNLQNGVETDGTLQLEITSTTKRLLIDFRERLAMIDQQVIGWKQLGFECLPTYAADRYELCLDVAPLDVSSGDVVSIRFLGSDSFSGPVRLTVPEQSYVEPIQRTWDKLPGKVRIINQNTLRQGLADPERSPKFKRLLSAIEADVLCFQEEWEEPLCKQGLQASLPNGGVNYRYVWNGGCAIATQLPMNRLNLQLDRAVAGLIMTPDQQKIIVFSVHFKCCGYTSSEEDGLRLQQAAQIVDRIRGLRSGRFGIDLMRLPIVVVGDYNLVGSKTPLDSLEVTGLKAIVCRNANGSAYTWRGLSDEESFWPGRLDLISAAGFKETDGRIFDSNLLQPSIRSSMGLTGTESLASDHLMLVVDLELDRNIR